MSNQVDDVDVDYHHAVAAVVNGKAFPVGIDDNDILRFQNHKWVNPHLEREMTGWNDFLKHSRPYERLPAGIYDPSNMFMDMYAGRWTREDVVAEQTSSGYSVSGICDLSTVQSLDLYLLDTDGDLVVVTYVERSDDDEEDL